MTGLYLILGTIIVARVHLEDGRKMEACSIGETVRMIVRGIVCKAKKGIFSNSVAFQHTMRIASSFTTVMNLQLQKLWERA